MGAAKSDIAIFTQNFFWIDSLKLSTVRNDIKCHMLKVTFRRHTFRLQNTSYPSSAHRTLSMKHADIDILNLRSVIHTLHMVASQNALRVAPTDSSARG